MQDEQREQNPDVNSYFPNDQTGIEEPDTPESDDQGIESPDDKDIIPVPPDSEQRHPISDPPYGDDSPMGDVDDSPKQIAG